MGGLITDKQRDQRITSVLSFIFLFRFVTAIDLDLVGSALLGFSMRRIIEYLLKYKLIKSFGISNPVITTGYYLSEDGLAKLPDIIQKYKYSFWPARYKDSTFYHERGIIETCVWVHKWAGKGRWFSEWMIRQDRIKASGSKGKGLGWRKRSVLDGRVPDGLFVIEKGARIAIEFESTRKNRKDWERMISNLEYGMKARQKVNLTTMDLEFRRDFEAVLFIFQENSTFELYRKRFDEYSKPGENGSGRGLMLEGGIKYPHCFFLTTMEHLKNGNVFNGTKEIGITTLLERVPGLHK